MPPKRAICTLILIPLLSPKQANVPTALALGSFDGLHAGHKRVINAITNNSHGVPTIVSFWPHPREVLYGESRLRLDLPSEKKYLLEPIGIKQLVLVPFDHDLASLNPETFVKKILINTLKARHIAVGENFRFGHNREGNSDKLKQIAEASNIKVSIIPILEDKEGRISSSRIRSALTNGDLLTAESLLDRPYSFRGIVVKGKGIGSKIGWATANLQVDGRKFLPGLGVYAAWAWQEEEKIRYKAVMNLGPQPTIDPMSPSGVEVHLLNQNIDLLGKKLIVEPVKRLRGQKKFKNVGMLSEQIAKDAQLAFSILN